MGDARRNAAIAVAVAAVLLGLLLRFESARHEATGAASSCRISDALDCDAVQSSPYAKALGVSLSTWGAAGHLVLLLWLVLARRAGGSLLAAAGALAALNLLAAAATAFLSLFVLGTVCLYCTALQLCIVALAFLLLPPAWRAFREGLARRPLALGGAAAAIVLVLALAGEAYATERTRLLRLFHQPAGAALRLDISDSLTLGDPATPYSVVLFFDFGCGYCHECYKKAVYLVDRFPTQVHFRFKHFPLDRDCNPRLEMTVHPAACRAARASQAAAALGRDAEALHFLFERRLSTGFTRDVIEELGRTLGVAPEEWERLNAAPEIDALLLRDIAEGNRLDLNAVPMAYINGRPADAQRLPETVERLAGR